MTELLTILVASSGHGAPASDAGDAAPQLIVLTLVALVIVSYLMSHWFVDRLRARFLFTTGAEYIAVGLLLGPVIAPTVVGWLQPDSTWKGVLNPEIVRQVAPIMSLAIGWMGLIYGMQANLRELVMRREGAMRLALVEGVLTMAVVGWGSWQLLRSGLVGDFEPRDAEIAAWILGASAAVGSAGAIDLVRRVFGASGEHTELLDRAIRLGELVAIALFGLVFCMYHEGAQGTVEGWNAANWVLVTIGLGVGLGVLFYLFLLGEEHEPDKEFLALLGIIVFASGAAWFLQISPLVVNLILGAMLANLAPNAAELRETLARYHRPMVLLLLIFAGALWSPPGSAAVAVLAVAYVAVRSVARVVGGWLAVSGLRSEIRRDIGRGLIGQGEVAVALAISYRLVYQGPVVDLAFTAILASVVISDLWSARLVKGLLIDAGDIQGERTVLRGEA